MTFWAYMLHCRGGAFYTGHADDLERRVMAHRQGLVRGFTSDKLPVELVWSEQFPTRLEALEAERRIKGWSRAKKMALIRGDWEMISRLSRSGSTSAAESVRAEPVEVLHFEGHDPTNTVLRQAQDERQGGAFSLFSHPSHPPRAVRSIDVEMSMTASSLSVTYCLRGSIDRLIVPSPGDPHRAHELWRTTCFELFVSSGGERYREYNFSPSRAWAAYEFDAYREGMREAPAGVVIDVACTADTLRLAVDLTADLQGASRVGLTAVVEDEGGRKSYWALAHPSGPPDFHDPSCFVARMPE